MRILIVGADSPCSFIVARCLAARGDVRLYGIGDRISPVLRLGNTFRALQSGVCAEDTESWYKATSEAIARWRIEVVLPIDERANYLLAVRRSNDLPSGVAVVPTPPPESIEIARDKRRFVGFLRQERLPHPPTFRPDFDEDLVRATLPAPFLIKPAISPGGGFGIERIQNVAELVSRLAARRDVIVQSEVDGTDFGVNLLCENGEIRAATIQRATMPSSKPFDFAVGITFEDRPDLLALCERLARALHWSGVANIDFRREATTGRFLFLELNGRFWGSLLGSLSAGVNFPWLACCLALGAFVKPTPRVGGRYFRGAGPILTGFLDGAHSIRLNETDWRYVRGDPIAIAAWIAMSLSPSNRRI